MSYWENLTRISVWEYVSAPQPSVLWNKALKQLTAVGGPNNTVAEVPVHH